MNGDPMYSAMAIREDLCTFACLTGERIAGRWAAIIKKPQYFPTVLAEVLREVILIMVGNGHVQESILTENNAGTQISVILRPGIGDKQILEIVQLRTIQGSPRQGDRRTVFTSLVVGEINEAVLHKPRVQGNVHQTCCSYRE